MHTRNKTVQLWQNQDRQREVLTDFRPPTDLWSEFVQAHTGQSVKLILSDMQSVNVILLGQGRRVVAVHKAPFFNWILIHKQAIIGMATR